MPRFKCALQALPCIWLFQQLFRFQHQEAAIGLMECTWTNQGEVCSDRAILGQLLHMTQQVVMRCKIFKNQRYASVRVVCDNHICRIAGWYAAEWCRSEIMVFLVEHDV